MRSGRCQKTISVHTLWMRHTHDNYREVHGMVSYPCRHANRVFDRCDVVDMRFGGISSDNGGTHGTRVWWGHGGRGIVRVSCASTELEYDQRTHQSRQGQVTNVRRRESDYYGANDTLISSAHLRREAR